MATERVIDLTESQVIAANFAALGIDPSMSAVGSVDDAVFDAYVRFAKEHKQLPTHREIARTLGLARQTVTEACQRLRAEGRMQRVEVKGRPFYLPMTVER